MDNMPDSELLDYLCANSTLTRTQCARLVMDVLNEYEETLEAFVQRRHGELKAQTGLKNAQIYEQIVAEISKRRFAVDSVSPRQVRRLIYG